MGLMNWDGILSQAYNRPQVPQGTSLGGPMGDGEYQSPDTTLALLQYLLRGPQAVGPVPGAGLMGPPTQYLMNRGPRVDPFAHGPISVPNVPFPQEPPSMWAPPQTGQVGMPGLVNRNVLRTGLLGQPVGTGAPTTGVPTSPVVSTTDMSTPAPQAALQQAVAQQGMPTTAGYPNIPGNSDPNIAGISGSDSGANGVTWDKVNGLLTNPALQGLMSGSLALMAKGGYSPRPINLAEGLGTAGQEGLNAAVSQQDRNRRYELLAEQAASLRASRQVQMQQMQAQIEAKVRTNQLLAMLPQIQAMPDGPQKQAALAAVQQQLYPEDYVKAQLEIMKERNKPIKRAYGEEINIPATGETFGKAQAKLEPVVTGVQGQPQQTTTTFVNPYTGLPPGAPEGSAPGTGLTPKTNQPLVQVDMRMPGSQAVQEQQAKDLAARQSQLRDIPYQMQETINLMGKIKDNPFIGSFGAQKMATAQFLNNNFGTNIAADKIADAAEFNRQTMEQVAQQLRKIDSNPTQRQQDQLRDALGSLNSDPTALRRLMEVRVMYMRHALQGYNADVQSAKKNNTQFLYDPTISGEPPLQPFEGGQGNLIYNPATGQIERK